MIKKRLLLLVIYCAFISLGLPDSLLGSGWPSMTTGLQVPTYFGGYLSMIIAAGTVISSLFSGQLIKRFGVGNLTTLSVFITACALIGFSFSKQYLYLCFLSIPLGLGAGSVDSALNHYVALHYEAKHMNWLHAFWGIGASLGPLIMSFYLAQGQEWSAGYRTVGIIQFSLVLLLIFSASLWIRASDENKQENSNEKVTKHKNLFSLPGLKATLVMLFCYGTMEATFGLWGASFLVFTKNFSADQAAKFAGFYYGGITLGRLLSGFLTTRFTNKQLVYFGLITIALGLICLTQTDPNILLLAFVLIGLGCAPIFPSLLHDTPLHFGEENSESIMGIQMASSYIGITLMPLLFGFLTSQFGFKSLLVFLSIFLLSMIVCFKIMNQQFVQLKQS